MTRHLIMLLITMSVLGCASTSTTMRLSSADPFEVSAQADFAYDRGDWLVAARNYERLAAIVPNDAYALTRLGNIRLKQNDFGGAVHAYEKALERDPTAARAHYNLATAHLLLARNALQSSLRNLPRNDNGAQIIHEKLKHFDVLVYEPLIEVASPNDGLIKQAD